VYLNGTVLPSYYQIISVQVKQGYQYISSAQILIKQDIGFYEPVIPDPLAKKPIAGEKISVKANLDGEEVVLFEGFIVKHNYKNSTQGTRLQLTAKNKIVNMSMSTKTEVFARQTDREILDVIAQNNGFSVSTTLNVTNQLTNRHTQLVKHEVSDWDFINLRAEANSCFVFTDNETIYVDKPTVEVNPLKIITANYGQNVYELQLEQDDRKNQIENELISFDTSGLESVVTQEEELSLPISNTNVKGKHSAINYRTYNELEAAQMVGSSKQIKTISTVNGVAHIHANLSIKPGASLKINGYNDVVNQSYIITSVLHDYSESGFSTHIQFGLNHQSFACKYNLAQKAQQAPLIVSGIVTQLEQDPDNLYRILVNIPSWKNAQESVWARITTPYAGDNYGLVLLPEIGDEVIISFIGNDFDSPIVIGSTFNPKTIPHTAYKDDNFDKVFITKKGMKWSWNDDKAIHEISTPAGNKILISEDSKSIIIEDQNQNKIEMKNDAINIESNLDINLKATNKIKLEAANIEVNASGISEIKGGLVKIN
jgi:Rhs element Vgr protein